MATNGTVDEIGHSFRCRDVYPVQRFNHAVRLADNSVCRKHCPLDWSNGTNGRYYRSGNTQEVLIWRLLMCGFDYRDARDMSAGSVHGFTGRNEEGLVDVGFFTHGTRRAVRLHH